MPSFKEDARRAQALFHSSKIFKFKTLKAAKAFADAAEEATGVKVNAPKKIRIGSTASMRYRVTVEGL